MVCHEVMRAPVRLQHAGGGGACTTTLCAACEQKLERVAGGEEAQHGGPPDGAFAKCPQCRNVYTHVVSDAEAARRCAAVYTICVHSGCGARFRFVDREAHESRCIFQSHACPFPQCGHAVPLDKFPEHVESHGQAFLESLAQNLTLRRGLRQLRQEKEMLNQRYEQATLKHRTDLALIQVRASSAVVEAQCNGTDVSRAVIEALRAPLTSPMATGASPPAQALPAPMPAPPKRTRGPGSDGAAAKRPAIGDAGAGSSRQPRMPSKANASHSWVGAPSSTSRTNGMLTRYYNQGFVRHGVHYRVGDVAMFLPPQDDQELYIGKITACLERMPVSLDGDNDDDAEAPELLVNVRWFERTPAFLREGTEEAEQWERAPKQNRKRLACWQCLDVNARRVADALLRGSARSVRPIRAPHAAELFATYAAEESLHSIEGSAVVCSSRSTFDAERRRRGGSSEELFWCDRGVDTSVERGAVYGLPSSERRWGTALPSCG